MRIKSATVSEQKALEIQTEGAIELVESTIYIHNTTVFAGNWNNYAGKWNIQGPPLTCQHLVLPDLTYLVPAWRDLSKYTLKISVNAYQYDHLDYEQLLAGFPYKGNDGRLFPFARSGLKMVRKNF